jgi:iron complex transport system substrate-binding protein
MTARRWLLLIVLLAAWPSSLAAAETRSVTDMAGRAVQLPLRIQRVVTLGSLPVLNSFVFTLGEGRTIQNGLADFGRSPHWKYQTVFAPHLARQPAMQQPNREPNLEAILLAAPDVVLTMHRASVDLLKGTGIPHHLPVLARAGRRQGLHDAAGRRLRKARGGSALSSIFR